MSFKRFFKLFIYILTMITTIIYIVYRIFFTIPTKLGFVSIFFALLVLFVEIWEAFDFFIYFINILMVKDLPFKNSYMLDTAKETIKSQTSAKMPNIITSFASALYLIFIFLTHI